MAARASARSTVPTYLTQTSASFSGARLFGAADGGHSIATGGARIDGKVFNGGRCRSGSGLSSGLYFKT